MGLSPPCRRDGRRRGQVPLWVAVCLAVLFVIFVAIWTAWQTSDRTPSGKQTIVFWGSKQLGDDVETVIHHFEEEHPQYHVIASTAVARDLASDAQRLMCAVAGGVPPDVVWFDRFAIGEWASRGALTDLRPMLATQTADDPDRIDLAQYYDFALQEVSHRPPGSSQEPGIYGVPMTADIRFLFCNNDVLRHAGLVDEKGNPQPPRNWDELQQYATKLTIYRVAGDKRSGIVRLGFAPNSGNASLYMYAWLAGGEMMNADRTRVTMDSPPIVRALRFMTDVYDSVGGIGQVSSFEEAQSSGSALDPFMNGQLAVKIDGNWCLNNMADWVTDLDFSTAPAPMPQDRIDAHAPPVAWSGGYALVIPATARQKEGAFEFIRYLRSWRGVEMLEQGVREKREAAGRIYLPRIEVNRTYCERLFAEHIDQNPRIPPSFKNAYTVIRDLLPHTRIRPVTPVGQMLWSQQVRAYDAAVRHEFADRARKTHADEVKLALSEMQAPVQQQLDEILRPPPPTEVRWGPYITTYVVLVFLPVLAIGLAVWRKRRVREYRPREVGAAMLFASPWAIGFALLIGGPVVFSIVLSFTRYDVLSQARYVGVENYRQVLSDPTFFKSLLNTLYMVAAIPLGMIVSLGIALLLNRRVRAIGFYRASFYMPAIVPIVAASLMWIWILNPSYGLVNGALGWVFDTRLFHGVEHVVSRFTAEPFRFTLPLWLQDKNWSKPSLILMKLWAAGGGMIIWLAGLQSIPPDLYEAARVDGASAWQRFRNVTIPMLSPYILFNAIIGVIGTMQIFSEAYIMTPDGQPADSTLFYAYYLFKQAFQFFRMGYASALAWILFLMVLALTLVQMWLSKRWVHYEG